MRIIEDIINGASATKDKNGEKLTRLFYIDGLTPASDTLCVWGLSDGSTRIPDYGETHPRRSGVMVASINSVPAMKDGKACAKVTVIYQAPEISGSSTTGNLRIYGCSRNTFIDTDPTTGAPLTVKYTNPTSGAVLYNPIRLPVEEANSIIEYSRQESANNIAQALTYQAKINNATYLGCPKYSIKCRNIGFEKVSAGRFNARYVFEFNPRLWFRNEVFKDSISGKIPDDIIANPPATLPTEPDASASTQQTNGIRVCLDGKLVDFNALNLPLTVVLST